MVFLITLLASIAVCDVLFCDGALQRACEAVARIARAQCQRATLQLATDDHPAMYGDCRWK